MLYPRFYFRAVPAALILILVITACNTTSGKSSANPVRLTIGASENFTARITNTNAGKITWTSSDPAIASVDENGNVTAIKYRESSTGTGEVNITAAGENGKRIASFTVITTIAGQTDMMSLPPLKDQFSAYFLLGNIFHNGIRRLDIDSDILGGVISNERLKRHYNVLTAENEMKPAYLCGSAPGQYNQNNINTAKRMVDAALAANMKVVGHTLLWHSQIPQWQASLRTDTTTQAAALKFMRDFITDIMTEFKGKIYSWDVLNEAFPDSGITPDSDWKNVMRKDANGNPWYMKLGADFVYEAYLAARKADPNAILYYNDYNLDQSGKARMVHNMVKEVNDRYKREAGGTRLLIEGIGMQSHHNTGVSASRIRTTLNLFRQLGVRISISEIDILSQSWSEFSRNPEPGTSMKSTAANAGKLEAAGLYEQYFRLFIENADIIERVSFWGVYDEQSWRAKGLPLLFEGIDDSKAKPAYYSVIKSLKQ